MPALTAAGAAYSAGMNHLRPAVSDDAAALTELLARCEAVDGFPSLSEFKALRVPVADAVCSVVGEGDDGLAALGVAAWHEARDGEGAGYWAGEIVVDPSQRSTAGYLRVLDALVNETAAEVSWWTFSDQQRAAASAGGMVEIRALVLMELPLPADPAVLPRGLTVRRFEVGADEADWLVLNRRVFGGHPEAGSIDTADLELRMAQPWFDADGFLILFHGDEPLGYCWTKRHSAEVGEIYMIGLVPEARGRGLARPLTGAGLAYLNSSGATRVILYADAANEPAIGLYRSMGFQTVRRVALFVPERESVAD